MSEDHEPEMTPDATEATGEAPALYSPPGMFGGLIKPIPPTEAPAPLPVPTGPNSGGVPGPNSGFAPGPALAPVAPFQPGAPSIQSTAVETFQFEFVAQGTPYRAIISHHPTTGAGIELLKNVAGTWVKSTSSMKGGILGAFLFQQAYAQMQAQAHEANKK